jgi:phosphoglycolate phosphatase
VVRQHVEHRCPRVQTLSEPITTRHAADLLRTAAAVLLDFDGPVCSIFAGFPAPLVAARLRDLMSAQSANLPDSIYKEDDPLNVFRFAATLGKDVCKQVEEVLTEAEMQASQSARPTPGAGAFLRAWRCTRRPLAVVSNNSRAAVEAYLAAHHLESYVDGIAARTEPDPALMKPNPHLVLEAMRLVETTKRPVIMIGDSESDIHSARAAGVPTIGYANKPGKRERLTAVGAAALITSMGDLATALET